MGWYIVSFYFLSVKSLYMNLFWAALLGLIQGLTEFLPVSSSGHLVIAQSLIPNFSQPGVLFDVVLHGGTLVAVLYYFRKKLLSLNTRYALFLTVGTIPAVVAAIFFGNFLERLFSDSKWISWELMATGVLNILVDFIPKGKGLITLKNSFLVGVAQAISIIPGISRSGATIFTGVALKADRRQVAEFSFLLSIPAILGAMVFQLGKYGVGVIEHPVFYFTGFLISLTVGFLSIGIVFKFLFEKRFKFFGIYCIALGLAFLLFR